MKAQFTMEFILLFSIAFLVFLISLSLMVRYVDYSAQKDEMQKIAGLSESIKKDIVLAYESGTGFEVKLRVPDRVEGTEVEVLLDDSVDMLHVRSRLTNRTVHTALPEVSGSIMPGCNRITKAGGVVQIDQAC